MALRQERRSSNIVTQKTFTCSMSTIETLEKGVKYVQSQHKHQNDVNWYCSSIFNVNFEDISYFFLVFLLLTLNK